MVYQGYAQVSRLEVYDSASTSWIAHAIVQGDYEVWFARSIDLAAFAGRSGVQLRIVLDSRVVVDHLEICDRR